MNPTVVKEISGDRLATLIKNTPKVVLGLRRASRCKLLFCTPRGLKRLQALASELLGAPHLRYVAGTDREIQRLLHRRQPVQFFGI